MPNITDLLKNILSAVYGKDARQSIHDAVEQCYGKVGYYKPTVTNGVLSWTRSKDSLPSVSSNSIVGPQGNPGYTPVKGEDYHTEDEKNDLHHECVISLLDRMRANYTVESDGSITMHSMVLYGGKPSDSPILNGPKFTFTITNADGTPNTDFSDDPLAFTDGAVSIFVETPEGVSRNPMFLTPYETTAGTCVWDLSGYSKIQIHVDAAPEYNDHLYNLRTDGSSNGTNDYETMFVTIPLGSSTHVVLEARPY